MISLNEILKGVDFDSLPDEHKANLNILLPRLNQVRTAWGHPMIVDSGYRTMADHLRIYAAKGITDQSKIPMKSKHLSGAAADISDPHDLLQAWVKANEDWLVSTVGLWCERFDFTKNWVHFQCIPYGSWKPGGSIFFIP